MGSGEVLPGPDPPVRAEIVHEGERTRVTRVRGGAGTVIRKEPLGPDGERRVRHEVAVLERLRGVAGVAQLAAAPQYPGAIMLTDAGSTSLAGEAKPLPAGALTELAVRLGRAVAGMHRRGVLHRDITPANIVLSGDGAPCLVDFALATSLAEIRPEFTHHSEIAGTLAYLAPESTGRTGRPVDQRADLYALGATLYQLATGAPPFGSGDLLRLIHDHLARTPPPPALVNPAVPEPLSRIIMRLLEKEPDNRYQTAGGLVYDLEHLEDAGAAGLLVGEHDVPARLFQPSRLAGRDEEVAALEAAFEDALTGRCRGVLISGAPGVGKTALADQLRAVVAGRDGWFVPGKFDQYRRDLEFDAANQAFRALARLLLAEPDDEVARVRGQILRAIGPNAGLLAAAVPEFATLLAVSPDAGDPLTAQARAQRAAADALRAVASPRRPVVMFLDDLQWAGRAPLGFVDLVLGEDPVPGLLLVAAYRDDDVDAAHPLAAPLSRWLDEATVRWLRLDRLPGPSVVTMIADMLRGDRAVAAGLAEVIGPHTRGNPYETLELLSALRRDRLLTWTAAGWRWRGAAVRARLGRSDVAELLAARPAALPQQSRALLESMACLGGRTEISLLRVAAGGPDGAVEQRLIPAFDEGLLVMEPGTHPAVRFRHDRTREAILDGLGPRRQQALRLAIARRLAAVPELFAAAAEQYLPVAAGIDDAAERRRVAVLLRQASGQAALIGDYALVNALLTAALPLIGDGRDEAATLAGVRTARHAALYSLGRLDEADGEYQAIEELCATVVQRAGATALQVLSLTNRNRFADAIGLGIGSLGELGVTVLPPGQLPDGLDRQFGYLHRWLDESSEAADLARPEVADPAVIATATLINALLPVTYVADHATLAWLSLEALRIWLEYGPGPALVGPVSHTGFVAVTVRGDYALGDRALRRILAVGAARGYQPGTAQARFLHATLACWSGPLEDGLEECRRAREGLLAGGDLAYVGHSYQPTVYYLLDSAPSLGVCAAEAEAGLAFARRTGNEEASGWIDCCQWLAAVLRGEGQATVETAPVSRHESNPLALFHWHVSAAVAAAIFSDAAGLVRHTEAAMPLLPVAVGLYTTAVARLLRCLALAGQARAADEGERSRLLAELDELTRWLAARAADAPDNFLHLLRLAEAERAWAAGDFGAAGLAYDAARREAAQRQRPWHRALIAEHAARFSLSRGLDHVGYDLLSQAREQYLAWGATAKASQLDRVYPALRTLAGATVGDGGLPAGRAVVTTETIELLGIVSASQALSSETSVGRLRARVGEVLSAMTGATGVHLVLWSEDGQYWLLPAPDGGDGTVPVSGAGQERAVPVSVLRYVQRTRESLVVADAARDDRFARDPYFAGAGCCSLLAVPVLSRGRLRSVLLLENRLLADAFTARRLDAVNLIAGQLAVSLDNSQLYTEVRQIAGEQTALRRVAMLVAQAASPDSVFAAVSAEAGQLLGVDMAVLVRYDPRDALTVVGAWTPAGAPPPTPVGGRLPLGGQNVTSLVFRTGQTARTDYGDASGVIGDVATRDWRLRSSVGVPIRVEGRLWGCIVVGLTRAEPLTADAEARLAGFTELVATAIASAQARAELQSFGEEQAALRRVATLVARAAPPGEVFAAITAEVPRLLGDFHTHMLRYDPDGTATVLAASRGEDAVSSLGVGTRVNVGGRNVATLVFQTRQPARIDDYAAASGPVADLVRGWDRRLGRLTRSAVGVPISVGGRLWGVMVVSSAAAPLPADTETRLTGFTELAATAVANTEAQAALAASRARVVAADDQARRRIERDLHDGAQQRLVSLALLLRAAQASLPHELDAQLDHAVAEAASALDEVREIARGIHPAILAERGLAPTLKTLARRSAIPVDLRVGVPGRLPEPVEISAYYVIAEALTNAAKHARASTATVQIEVAGDALLLEVRDDGAGGADFSRGTGLAGLKDRVEALGGRIFLDSPPGAGTSLRVELPLTDSDAGVAPLLASSGMAVMNDAFTLAEACVTTVTYCLVPATVV